LRTHAYLFLLTRACRTCIGTSYKEKHKRDSVTLMRSNHNQARSILIECRIEVHQKLNLLVDHHSCLAKIFIVKDSITRHVDCSVFFIWTFWKFTHVLVQYVPQKITCMEEDINTLLNTTSMHLNHIAHNMVPIPTRKISLSFQFISYTQPPNMCLILFGDANPDTKCITL
jgi:hypothetical protein